MGTSEAWRDIEERVRGDREERMERARGEKRKALPEGREERGVI